MGDPALVVPLDPDEILAAARQSTGLHDVGDDAWLESYRRRIRSIDEDSQAHLLGRLLARAEALRCLQTNLRIRRAHREDPAILEEPISRPIFVVGAPPHWHVDPAGASGPRSRAEGSHRVGGPPSVASRRCRRHGGAHGLRRGRAGALGRHPAGAHDPPRASQRSPLRVRPLHGARFRRGVLGDAVPDAGLRRLGGRAGGAGGAHLPPAPELPADPAARGSRAAVAAQDPRPPLHHHPALR